MGGGIAYQSAVKGTPIIHEDIRPEALDLGLNEAGKLLSKQVEKGKMKSEAMKRDARTHPPTLNYGDLRKSTSSSRPWSRARRSRRRCFAEVEGLVRDDTIIASNTSTISISYLAEGLKRRRTSLACTSSTRCT